MPICRFPDQDTIKLFEMQDDRNNNERWEIRTLKKLNQMQAHSI